MTRATKTIVSLDAAINDRVARLASVKQRSMDWLMQEAIAQYVVREEQGEQRRQNAAAVWDAYRVDGLHVTAEEADAWLARLEAGEDAEPPACHA